MKMILAGVFIMVLVSCNSNSPGKDFSTVDSNVAGTPDSIPSTLYLDSHQVDTSFPVAMDSAGATINPQDTNYQNPH
jgi:hypothetical protein